MADNFLALLETAKPEILARLPEWLTPDRWWAMAVEISRSPDLQRVAQSNPASLINAMKRIADWGLELDGEEAIIVVYGNEATPQSMYRGRIRRAVEAGVISHAVADVIKEGDQIEIVSGTRGRELVHRPAFSSKDGKREIIGGYAVFVLPNGTTDYELFEKSDIEAVKAAALRMAQRRDKSAGLSPAWRFFEGEMVKKSVLTRGLKRFRGKRDTEAGRRFAELDRSEVDITPPENPADCPPPQNPQARGADSPAASAESAGGGIKTPAPGGSAPAADGKLTVKPDEPKIGQAGVAALMQFARDHKRTPSEALEAAETLYGDETEHDPENLTATQRSDIERALTWESSAPSTRNRD